MGKLSDRQQQILDFIRHYKTDNGFAPSVRDIQAGCDISSTSVVDYNLRILHRDGHVRRSSEIARGLDLVDSDDSENRLPGVHVPLLGYIAAGQPIPVMSGDVWQEEGYEQLELPQSLVPRQNEGVYALRVKGHSMVDALIGDGDVVILRPVAEISNGDMVAAWLMSEEEATLKKIYYEGEHIRLQPCNEAMEPIIVPTENVVVHGKVVAVLRQVP